MNTPDISVKNQEQPSTDTNDTLSDIQENRQEPPESVDARPVERDAGLYTPAPPMRPQQLPGWTGYAPDTPPPWAWQPGAATRYPPRRPIRWPWILLTLAIVFLLITVGTAALFGFFGVTGFATSSTETRTFSVNAYPTLILNNDTGSIHVRAAADEHGISIHATKHGSSWANLNDVQVAYAHTMMSNTVTVTVNRANAVTFFTATSVDFDVTVPSATMLQLKTNTGSIDVSGISGQMMLSSNTGSLEVSNGTIRGNSALTTNTGSVTFNGAIEQSGTYTFTTDTGSVNVTLPANSTFHMDAATNTGSINTNAPTIMVQHHQMTGADAHGDVGASPQATVTLSTSTGSINLYLR